MKLLPSIRKLEKEIGDAVGTGPSESRLVLRNVGLVSAGITVLAVAVVLGREIRQRYKFNRRTPYDFYEHSGDQMQDVELGVGI